MNVYGVESIRPLLDGEGYLFKLLANDRGVILFPRSTEHRDATQPGIRYADNSKGNALAAMVKPGRIEFRYHQEFTDEQVRDLSARLLTIPELSFAKSFTVTYQARTVIEGTWEK